MANIAVGAAVLVGDLPGKVLSVWNAANGMRNAGNWGLILLENGKRITVDLNTVTVVAEAAASGGVAPIITPLVVGAVTAAIPFVPGVGPVVGGLVSSGLGLASIAVPAALRAMRGQNQSDAHGHQ